MVESGLLGKLYSNVIFITNYFINNTSNSPFITLPTTPLTIPLTIPFTTSLTTPPTIPLITLPTTPTIKTTIYFS